MHQSIYRKNFYSATGKSQIRRQYPDRKIIDSPFMIETTKKSTYPESQKNHRHLPLPPSEHLTVSSFGQKSEKIHNFFVADLNNFFLNDDKIL